MGNAMLARYERAHTIKKGKNNNQLARNDTVFPHWITYADNTDSHYFWYRRITATGKEYRLVDSVTASNEPAFDHNLLASTLTEVLSHPVNDKPSTSEGRTTDQLIDPLDLPLTFVNLTLTLTMTLTLTLTLTLTPTLTLTLTPTLSNTDPDVIPGSFD